MQQKRRSEVQEGVTIIRRDRLRKVFKHFPDLYGYRGNNVRVYYLSPWVFLMFWTVKSVPSPSEDHNLSFWVEGWSREALQGARPEPGVHVEINEEIESDTILLFPKEYRHSWYMDENKFLLVPAPASSDLPDRQQKPRRQEEIVLFVLATMGFGSNICLQRSAPHH